MIKAGHDPGYRQKENPAVGLQSRGARDRNGRLVKIKAVKWGRPEEAENRRQHHNF